MKNNYVIINITQSGKVMYYLEDANLFHVKLKTIYASKKKAEEKAAYARKYASGSELAKEIAVININNIRSEKMVDFAEKARISKQAEETLNNILRKEYDNFDQYEEVNKITDLEVAKVIIKRLLDKLN